MYFSKIGVTKVLHFAGNMQKKLPCIYCKITLPRQSNGLSAIRMGIIYKWRGKNFNKNYCFTSLNFAFVLV